MVHLGESGVGERKDGSTGNRGFLGAERRGAEAAGSVLNGGSFLQKGERHDGRAAGPNITLDVSNA